MEITPGKVEDLRVPGSLRRHDPRLTIDDAESLRRVPGVEGSSRPASGQARVEAGERGRSVYVYGVTHEASRGSGRSRSRQGSFLPELDPHRQGRAVLGPTVARELFGMASPLGRRVRIGG